MLYFLQATCTLWRFVMVATGSFAFSTLSWDLGLFKCDWCYCSGSCCLIVTQISGRWLCWAHYLRVLEMVDIADLQILAPSRPAPHLIKILINLLFLLSWALSSVDWNELRLLHVLWNPNWLWSRLDLTKWSCLILNIFKEICWHVMLTEAMNNVRCEVCTQCKFVDTKQNLP